MIFFLASWFLGFAIYEGLARLYVKDNEQSNHSSFQTSVCDENGAAQLINTEGLNGKVL